MHWQSWSCRVNNLITQRVLAELEHLLNEIIFRTAAAAVAVTNSDNEFLCVRTSRCSRVQECTRASRSARAEQYQRP
jgi:hypothetical protein